MDGGTVTCQTCYNEVPVGTNVCGRCGSGMASQAIPQTSQANVARLVFRDRKSGNEMVLEGDVTIGRGGSGTLREGVFTENPHVSAPHCEVMRDGDMWLIKDVGSMNKTAVDGVVLEPDVPIRLRDGSKLRIADVYLAVSVIKGTVEERPNEGGAVEEGVGEWEYYVKCPECGWEKVLGSSDDKVESCGNCGDVDSVPYIRPLSRRVENGR